MPRSPPRASERAEVCGVDDAVAAEVARAWRGRDRVAERVACARRGRRQRPRGKRRACGVDRPGPHAARVVGAGRVVLEAALKRKLEAAHKRKARARRAARAERDRHAALVARRRVGRDKRGALGRRALRAAEERGAAALHEVIGWALGCVEDAAAEREPALGADRAGCVDGFGKRDARPEEVPCRAVCLAQLRLGGPRASVAASTLRWVTRAAPAPSRRPGSASLPRG